MYPAGRILQISSFCDKFKCLFYKGCRYISNPSNYQLASTIFAQWFDDTSRPAVIREFLQHDVVVQVENGKSQRITHILALVEWYVRHPQCNKYSKPVEVWANHFETVIPGHAYYVPVGRFQSNCVSVRQCPSSASSTGESKCYYTIAKVNKSLVKIICNGNKHVENCYVVLV